MKVSPVVVCGRVRRGVVVGVVAGLVMMPVGACGQREEIEFPAETSHGLTQEQIQAYSRRLEADRSRTAAARRQASEQAKASGSDAASGSDPFAVPEAAKAHTQAGAIAYVKFYWETLGKLDKKPQTGVIPKLALSTCTACARQEETFTSFAREGVRVESINARISNVRVRPDSLPDSVVVQFHQQDDGGVKYETSGKMTKLSPIDADVEMRADWVGGAWKLGAEGAKKK